MKRRQRWTGFLALALVLTPGLALAFVLTTGRPSDNVSGAGLRAPGLMVSAGIGRHGARTDDFSSVKQITQSSRSPGLVDLFLPEWIDTIFAQLNSGLDLLISALFLRAGETPPALGQLSSASIPSRKVKELPRRSLTDRTLDRLPQDTR